MNEAGLKLALYNWLSTELGVRHVFTITFDADFVSGNTINGSFDAEAIDPVSFVTSHAVTLAALATEIQKCDEIFKAEVTASRQITCTGFVTGDTISVTGPTVSGGATQAVATIATTTAASSVPCIFADRTDDTGRAAPRPETYPYATIRLGTIIQVGHDELRDIDEDTCLANIGGQRRGTVSINFFGPRPFENVMKAYNSLEKMSLIDTFYAAGFSILEKNDVQNLTGMLETKFEERASFDFFIGFAENIEDDLGIIETVDLTATVTADGKDPDVDLVTVGPITIGV